MWSQKISLALGKTNKGQTFSFIFHKFLRVNNKKDLYAFDQFMDKLYNMNPYEVRIIENFDEYAGENVNDDTVSTLDTPTLLNTYVDSLETDLETDRLKTMLQELFVEAQQIESI